MKIAHTVGWLSAGSGAFAGHRVDSEETFQLLLTEILSVSELEGTEKSTPRAAACANCWSTARPRRSNTLR